MGVITSHTPPPTASAYAYPPPTPTHPPPYPTRLAYTYPPHQPIRLILPPPPQPIRLILTTPPPTLDYQQIPTALPSMCLFVFRLLMEIEEELITYMNRYNFSVRVLFVSVPIFSVLHIPEHTFSGDTYFKTCSDILLLPLLKMLPLFGHLLVMVGSLRDDLGEFRG